MDLGRNARSIDRLWERLCRLLDQMTNWFVNRLKLDWSERASDTTIGHRYSVYSSSLQMQMDCLSNYRAFCSGFLQRLWPPSLAHMGCSWSSHPSRALPKFRGDIHAPTKLVYRQCAWVYEHSNLKWPALLDKLFSLFCLMLKLVDAISCCV